MDRATQGEAFIEAEKAVKEEVHKFGLEFAELSVIMRELISKVYIRGGLDTLKRIKEETVE